ncbi:pimeloyl-ACP methyl ester carboxylesterase [Aeromicrobium panaciterrae]|uniref:Pimeloyl-ACP methyl ester carboxylesterase n=1 Tax=Aeromicrobium panaciterrae TaxID=363861 RepID=A0ABU1US44_9ACTN|nr:alpha/beta hydrolase [Aeromicrobium panaciterrae]MDR7087958.1 pimeloyl-ACP methyl ester carboxylesterase [Aeromicrobium panaciterrae]
MTSTPRPQTLGAVHEIDLGSGTVRYFEDGPADGPVVVFVHGLLVNADLWRKVVPTAVADGLHTYTVDWPLGSHSIPVPGVELTPPGVADLIATFLEKLDLKDVTVVANDTGGAITQILMTRHPERIGRVVLASCDAFERFFPPAFAFLPVLAKAPGSMAALTQIVRPKLMQRLPITFGWVSKRPVPPETVASYLGPSRHNRAIRKDLARFLKTVNKRHTLAAAEKLPAFDKPVLLAWATEEKLFPLSLATRLAEKLPNAKIVEIADSYTFIPEDQPAELAAHVVEFVTRVGA